MNTHDYIEMLKSTSTEFTKVCYRQALCLFLYRRQIPCETIAKALGCNRRVVYKRLHSCQDLLTINDELMTNAYNETESHKYRVQPKFVDAGNNTVRIGYTLFIDNIIY